MNEASTGMDLTIIALISVFPPSANDPAVAAKAGDEARHKTEKESKVSILGGLIPVI